MNPVLTVVIPVAKTAYLRETLASIARQMTEEITLLLVDSVDGLQLEPIVRETLAEVSYRLEKTRGLPMVDNWNYCMGLVQTEWAYMISDDDLMQQGLLPALVSIIRREPGLSCIAFRRHIYYMDDPADGEPIPGEIRHARYERWKRARYFRELEEGSIELPWFGNWICKPADFLRLGGFVRTRFGWGADTVGGLTNMLEGDVAYASGMAYHWRYSTNNVSAGFPHVLGAADLAACRAFWHQRLRSMPEVPEEESRAIVRVVDAFLLRQAQKHSLRSTVANMTPRQFWRRYRDVRRQKNVSLRDAYRGLRSCGVSALEIWGTALLYVLGIARPLQRILRKRSGARQI